MRALLLDGSHSGHRFECPDPPHTLAFPVKRPSESMLSEAGFAELLDVAIHPVETYSLAAVGLAGAVYVKARANRDMAEDFANDPDLWE